MRSEINSLNQEKACASLTPKEADAIFFPGSGGKPTQAKEICGKCPIQSMCLAQAIEKGLQGFWAGTTDKERTVMAAKYHIPVKPDIVDIPVGLPKRVLRRVSTHVADTLSYLDTLSGPPPEILQ